MVTLKDIAEQANVSLTTVSNVINGNHSKVSKKTIEKVQEIIKKNKYTPNMNAKALASNSSKIIGVVIPHFKEDSFKFLQNPFNSEVLCGIEDSVEKNGYYLMVKSVSSYIDIYKLLKTWNVDGVIILSLPDKESISLIETVDSPIVFIDSAIENENIMNVSIDDENAAFLATSHLIEKGHKNIGIVTYDVNIGGISTKRYKGYLRALKEHNIEFNPNNFFEVKLESGTFADISSNLLKNKNQISALFVTADILAIEVINFLMSNNVNVPNDISVMGFDNLYISEFITPKLTTINQDIIQKGIAAANLLINCIEKNPIEHNQIVLPTCLVERDSVKDLTNNTKK